MHVAPAVRAAEEMRLRWRPVDRRVAVRWRESEDATTRARSWKDKSEPGVPSRRPSGISGVNRNDKNNGHLRRRPCAKCEWSA